MHYYDRIIRNFGRRDSALIRIFIQWRLYPNRLSCWSALSLSRPSVLPARNAALNFEGSSAILCSLESCCCRRLRVMYDSILPPILLCKYQRSALYHCLWACTSETIPVLV